MADALTPERIAEIRRLHVPMSRCDVGEHGDRCPGSLRCKNCGGRWPCRFIASLGIEVGADE